MYQRPLGARRLRVAGVAVAALGAIALIVALLSSGGGHPGLPLPGIGRPARSADPFGWVPGRQSEFEARAVAGSAHVLFVKSPGGVLATAARVARWRGLIDRACAGTGLDPNVLEGIVFLESAGRPDVIAGTDPAAAAGLTQILAQTGQSLLGMHIDLPASRRLTRAITGALGAGRVALAERLVRQRSRVDDRFVPRLALAATIRYLKLAQARLGRPDLAVVSYHMGIGNLLHVLDLYDGGRAVPYAQLYFDTGLDRHAGAFTLLSGFGDDSSLYYWRVLGAVQIMRLYRLDRPALERLMTLQGSSDSNALVLHPPDRTPSFGDPNALYAAYARRTLLPLPANAAQLGLSYGSAIGSLARRLGVPPGLYRGLRGPALDLLVELGARVRALSGSRGSLALQGAVIDRRYEQLLGGAFPAQDSGYAFAIARRYVSRLQALTFQALLDRLQALNLIAWERTPDAIGITVASGASHFLVDGP